MNSTFEIEGYGIVLPLVQNYYPVEEDKNANSFCWGFKYTTGVFEYFHHSQKSVAEFQRTKFITALNNYYYQKGL